jgi:D-aminopeptidase
VIGETNDGYLNDIRGRHVEERHVLEALRGARGGPVAEGVVGAGTGTVAFGWKGGVGTSSRRLPPVMGGWTVGALVQTNFDGLLTIDGVRVGERLGRFPFREKLAGAPGSGLGSCMIVLATDAPLSARNLERLSERAMLGLARTGSFVGNGSGDFVIAFSTRNLVPHDPKEKLRRVEELENDAMDPLFLAAVESVEEAVYNSLTKATTVTGAGGRTVEAIPIDRLRELLQTR